MAVTTQFRRYTIKEGEMADWVAEWTAGVAPLRRRFGFTIPGAWILEGRNEFLWLLSYPGPRAAWEARNAEYYASPERVALAPDPARHIVAQETAFLVPVGE